MTRQGLIESIRSKNSFLCVGIDPVLDRLPTAFQNTSDPLFEFGKSIIEATHDLCVAYKLNTAFYEAHGSGGWRSLEKTIDIIPDELFVIADAKRGDIGHSSEQYARAFFDHLGVDAVTVSPYMGKDSIAPFVSNEGKWAIVLALTSNEGSADFQLQTVGDRQLYEEVIATSRAWGTPDNMMYVTGATQVKHLEGIRQLVPDHFLLVPAVGAQGGDLNAVCDVAMTKDCGLLVNVSRSIIYDEDVRAAASSYQRQMATLLAHRNRDS